MRTRGVEPNVITYNSLIDAAASKGEAGAAWEFYRDMVKCGFPGDKFTCSILIKTLWPNPTGDCIRKCLDLLCELGPVCDQELRTQLYNNIIEAALQLGDSTVLIRSFAQTQRHHVRPTAASCRQLKQIADQCKGPLGKTLEATVGDEGAAPGSALEEKQPGGHNAPPVAHDMGHDLPIEPQALFEAIQYRPRAAEK